MRKNQLTGAIFFFIFMLLASGIGRLSSRTVDPGFGVGNTQVISEAGQKEMSTPAMFMREPILSLQPDRQSIMDYGLGWFVET